MRYKGPKRLMRNRVYCFLQKSRRGLNRIAVRVLDLSQYPKILVEDVVFGNSMRFEKRFVLARWLYDDTIVNNRCFIFQGGFYRLDLIVQDSLVGAIVRLPSGQLVTTSITEGFWQAGLDLRLVKPGQYSVVYSCDQIRT